MTDGIVLDHAFAVSFLFLAFELGFEATSFLLGNQFPGPLKNFCREIKKDPLPPGGNGGGEKTGVQVMKFVFSKFVTLSSIRSL